MTWPDSCQEASVALRRGGRARTARPGGPAPGGPGLQAPEGQDRQPGESTLARPRQDPASAYWPADRRRGPVADRLGLLLLGLQGARLGSWRPAPSPQNHRQSESLNAPGPRTQLGHKALSGPAREPHGQHGGNQPGPAGQVPSASPLQRPVHPYGCNLRQLASPLLSAQGRHPPAAAGPESASSSQPSGIGAPAGHLAPSRRGGGAGRRAAHVRALGGRQGHHRRQGARRAEPPARGPAGFQGMRAGRTGRD
jgi:hypothetical protein